MEAEETRPQSSADLESNSSTLQADNDPPPRRPVRFHDNNDDNSDHESEDARSLASQFSGTVGTLDARLASGPRHDSSGEADAVPRHWSRTAAPLQPQQQPVRLLQLAQDAEFSKVCSLVKTMQQQQQQLMTLEADSKLRTAAHYAAMHSGGQKALKLLVDAAGDGCLLTKDYKGITPRHFSAKYHSLDAWVSQQGSLGFRRIDKKDDDGNTCAHWAAENQQHEDLLMAMVKEAGPQCLAWENSKDETVLQRAVEKLSRNVARQLLQTAVQEARKSRTPSGSVDWLRHRDHEGNMLAHYAARNSKDTILDVLTAAGSMTVNQQQCLSWKNNAGESAVHIAGKFCSPDAVLLIINQKGSSILDNRDNDMNTCLHVIAACQSDKVLLTAVNSAVPQCLSWLNSQRSTVLHLALARCGPETAKQLIKMASQDQLLLQDVNGDTCLHVAARRCSNADSEDPSILPTAVAAVGARCLELRNQRKETVLNCALENCGTTAAIDLIKAVDKRQLLLRDKYGDSCLHVAARRSDKQPVLSAAIERFGIECLYQLNKRKQSVVGFAIDVCTVEQLSKMPRSEIFRLDKFRNSLLHCLFQNYHTDSDECSLEKSKTDILQKVRTLVTLGVDPRAENEMSHSCLHTSQLNQDLLCKLLRESTKEEKLKSVFQSLLVSSTGHHAVHTFAATYNLEAVAEPLAELSGMEVSELLRLPVSKDLNKGATCLHFACEAGHEDNIVYLLNQGLQIKKLSQAGLSCIDYAIEKGRLEEVTKAIESFEESKLSNSWNHCSGAFSHQIFQLGLLQLIDPVHRGLRLPSQAAAQRVLSSVSDQSKEVAITQSKGFSRKERDKKVLLKAFELDSSSIYRSAMKMNVVTRDTEQRLSEYLCQTALVKEQHYLELTSEMSIIDIAKLHDKVVILPDLLLTRQFDLIPAGISLLIQLGPQIIHLRAKARGKHEQLEQLQRKVICIVVNALNALFVNASEERKELDLLFRYIRGDLKDRTGANSGPRFPLRCDNNKIKHCTVLELVEKADCNELFATDCIYSAVEREWKRGRPACKDRNTSCTSPQDSRVFSPRTKFYSHLVSFGLFIIFFAWFIVDFNTSFKTWYPDIVLLMYALSFALQEVVDFYKRREMKPLQCKMRVVMCPSYWWDALNYFELSAMFFLLAGLIWKWLLFANSHLQSEYLYPCQMLLSTSFALFGFRSVTYLNYSDTIGPMITMLWSLIVNDLFPFLAIIVVIFYSFGVFFFNLLFTVTINRPDGLAIKWYWWDSVVQILTLPFDLLFTNFDVIQLNTSMSDARLGERAHKDGLGWFNHFLMFLFMGLVNVVMLNLLIALFNLRVSRMAGEAVGIWRKAYLEMLRDYESMGPMPPPFSFVWYIYNFICGCRNYKVVPASEKWSQADNYTEDYVEFLQFQAAQFRQARPRLLCNFDVGGSTSAAAPPKGFTGDEQQLSTMHAELHEALDELRQRLDQAESRGLAAEPNAAVGGTPKSVAGCGDQTSAFRAELHDAARSAAPDPWPAASDGKMKRLQQRVKEMHGEMKQILQLLQQKQQQPQHLQ